MCIDYGYKLLIWEEVEKLECIGHVQNRMGTALRTLRKEKKI